MQSSESRILWPFSKDGGPLVANIEDQPNFPDDRPVHAYLTEKIHDSMASSKKGIELSQSEQIAIESLMDKSHDVFSDKPGSTH